MPSYIACSPWLIAVASILYLNIAIALTMITWPRWWLFIPAFIILVRHYWHVIMTYGVRTDPSSVAVLRKDCDKWLYELFSGKRYKGTLITNRSYRSRLILILFIQSKYDSRYIIIPRDSLSCHNYRYLAMHINN